MKKILSWFNFAILLAITGFLLLTLVILWIILINKNISFKINPIDFDLAAKIGSYIGGVIGVFWSGAGVILIYATFNKQQEFNTNQAFEQSFQNLMNSYHIIVNNTRGSIDLSNNNQKIERIGQSFYSSFLKKMKYCFEDTLFLKEVLNSDSIPETKDFKKRNNIEEDSKLPHPYITVFGKELKDHQHSKNEFSLEFTIKRYEFYYRQFQNCLGHYFRFIYNTFKLIIVTKESESEREKYINLIQAHMSNDELGILFYNALSKYSFNKLGICQFKNWLEKYDFFENIDENSLMSKHDTKYYDIDFKFENI